MIQKTNDQPSPMPVKKYWRSLDQLLGNPEVNEVIDHDFGAAAPEPGDGFSRRRWLQLMGASMAFGAVSGCRFPDEKITPFAFRPAGRTPGVPENFSTMLEFGGIARPLVSTSYDGRPIKLDGNPDHADSMGASDTYTQATILELYDPDRSRGPARAANGSMEPTTWDDATSIFKTLMAEQGVAVLSEPSSSPSLHRLKKAALDANSNAKWYEFTSVSADHSDAGARMAFGSVHRPVYHLADAKIIVTVDADPLAVDPATIRLARDFADSRDADHGKMSRLYAVESNFSTTGAMADHRLPLQFKQIGSFLAALEAAIDSGVTTVDSELADNDKMLAAMASDLLANKGAGVVRVGPCQPAEVHARAFRINQKLENIGQTVHLHAVENAAEKTGVDQLKELTDAINAGTVTTLVILGGNPVFYAPSDLKFQDALAKVTNSVHLSVYRDETSRACKWHLNAAHPLESWGDGQSYDGSTLIAQPLLEPLFDGKSPIEFLATLLGMDEHSHDDEDHEHEAGHSDDEHNLGLTVVKETVGSMLGGSNPEAAWQEAVRVGFIDGSAGKPASPSLAGMNLESDVDAWKSEWSGGEAELIFRPSKSIYDGRYANNGWLQELPEFLTKLTWDNAALVSTVTAEKLGLTQGKLANFKVDDNQITLPVYVLPGMPHGTICTWLGYGRDSAGRVAGDADLSIDSIGHDVRPLRTSGNWWSVPEVVTDPTSDSYLLATTQEHFQIDAIGRDEINRRMAPEESLIRAGTYNSYEKFVAEHGSHDEHDQDDHSADAGGEGDDHAAHDDGQHHSWPEGHHLHFKNFDLTRAGWLDNEVKHKWGMSIDLNRCNGCNACVIACQSENNIPVVGKDQVSRGREMQWMRIDRYFITDENDDQGNNPHIAHQPLTCQQCEKAPCETVCPVAATVHSDEGLNDMVYNRCIGTRYCGNNCPYKVRRFNYYNYTDATTFLKVPGDDRLEKADLQLQSLMMNPEVTVRSRGVMEKCTYCVQRIQNTKIKAKREGNRPLGANEIKTACQDVCPANAIVFGDIQNPESDVARNHANPRAYALLEELNVYPRTRYLARVTNPHPALVNASAESGAH